MIIIGCDYHPGFQQKRLWIPNGDYGEQRLEHSEGAEKVYRDLAAQGKKVRVGMEASGHARWFERLLAEVNFELWIGTPPRSPGSANASRDGSAGCAAYSAVADGESFSQDLGTEWGESGSAATVVASASHGADADSDHESTASGALNEGYAAKRGCGGSMDESNWSRFA